MNRLFASIVVAAALSISMHAEEPSLTMRTLEPSRDDNFIPARVPGFELRELNKKRTITYAIDSETEVRLSFPVLIYFPVSDGTPRPEVPELRRIYNDLATVAARSQDPDLLSSLLKIDRLLADMGEKRETPAAYPAQNAPAVSPGPRVISEKRISADVPPQALVSPDQAAPRAAVLPSPRDLDELPISQVAGKTAKIEPTPAKAPSPDSASAVREAPQSAESPASPAPTVMPKMASTK